jgi:hypothetical protein
LYSGLKSLNVQKICQFFSIIKMIEHIMKFYGINSNNKMIGYFTTGLILSIFLSFLFPLIFANNFGNNSKEFFKLFLTMFYTSNILNYLIIKYNSAKLFQLYYKLKEYQNKCLINEFNIQIYSIISILIFILMAFLTTKFHFCESFIIEIMEN